jgi:hypothetical protein
MKLFRTLSFLRKPFGKLTALSLSKGQESMDEDGFRVVPGMTQYFRR